MCCSWSSARSARSPAPYHHLYYLPIILAARRFEVRGAASTATASIVLYHLANPGLVAIWYREADLVQIALFIGVGLVTAKFARDARQLGQLATTGDLTGLTTCGPLSHDSRRSCGPPRIIKRRCHSWCWTWTA